MPQLGEGPWAHALTPGLLCPEQTARTFREGETPALGPRQRRTSLRSVSVGTGSSASCNPTAFIVPAGQYLAREPHGLHFEQRFCTPHDISI